MTAITSNDGPNLSRFGDYRDKVNVGLFADVLEVCARRGISRVDNDPIRLSRALEAICHLADALAGPPPS